jgi:hypothetical protein
MAAYGAEPTITDRKPDCRCAPESRHPKWKQILHCSTAKGAARTTDKGLAP